jgi:peptide/nickel transport system permease protein
MLRFIGRRALIMIVTLFVISLMTFVIIQLPPGDFLTAYVAQLSSEGDTVNQDMIDALRVRYGLDQPFFVQYGKWMSGLFRGDLGRSLGWHRTVSSLLEERLPWSMAIALASFVFVYFIGIPIGVFSATHKYSLADYFFTFVGFIGVATPSFLIALVALWLYFSATGDVIVGLFSREFMTAPFSLAKVLDLLKHLWIPGLITGMSGMAGLIRVTRANLLDELEKPYVTVARAKGLTERRLLYKYPFRIAMNPAVSTIGWQLPHLVSGEMMVSIVLGLPTVAPILKDALLSQDMFLAGSIIMITSILTVIGTLLSDLLLAWIDPRIRSAV